MLAAIPEVSLYKYGKSFRGLMLSFRTEGFQMLLLLLVVQSSFLVFAGHCFGETLTRGVIGSVCF